MTMFIAAYLTLLAFLLGAGTYLTLSKDPEPVDPYRKECGRICLILSPYYRCRRSPDLRHQRMNAAEASLASASADVISPVLAAIKTQANRGNTSLDWRGANGSPKAMSQALSDLGYEVEYIESEDTYGGYMGIEGLSIRWGDGRERPALRLFQAIGFVASIVFVVYLMVG